MKKDIIFILLSLGLLLAACKKEDYGVQTYNLGTEIYISGSSYTTLDEGMNFTVSNPLQNLSQVTLTHLGITDLDENYIDPPKTDLGSISFSGGEGSILIPPSAMGMTQFDETADIEFAGEFENKPFTRTQTVTYTDPFSIEAPEMVENSDTAKFYFTVEPSSASVTGVTVETALNFGAYSSLSGDWQAEDSITFYNVDYAEGDTILVKITATSDAGKTAENITKIGIAPYTFASDTTFTLVNGSGKAYDLIEHRHVDPATAGDSADIMFAGQYAADAVSLGFTSAHNAEFVEVTTLADSVFALGNVVQAQTTDFSSATKTVDNAETGSVYIFRTRRGSGAYTYGYVQVINIDLPQGKLDDASIELDLKY